ncbi:sigma-54-dependent Fis family transcriptional regulator [Hyalangium minutum]|uniref:Response regulator of zinc sigma-54-dependent two-component system n=1 Tax=Hyalangium minutum TaxID=394096 RepID=A0A085WS27_9BACT|nr:sigma-54-dependent Fis family transcriptional regulator [Hyalangium minutum]KFE70490.1 Response regulator of zinc sigma-54-dependent two-component system [Hyalangium minutum]
MLYECYGGGTAFVLPPLPTMPQPSDVSQVLLSVGSLVGREVDLDAFLQTLVDRIAITMQADRGTLWLLDPARGELFSRAAHLPEVSQIRVKLGQGVAGHVAQAGESVNVPEPRGERLFFADIDRMTGYRTTSLLAVPLRDTEGAIYGVLQVLNKRGAERFTEEDIERLTVIAGQVGTALQSTSLYQELKRAKDQPQAPVGYFFNRIIGESPQLKSIYRLVQKAAPTDATVLLRGESGCGKELFARAIHVNGPRRDKPFVKVDCAALPATLIENELFGHEKGAYTGADHRVPGKFEAADSGTVFIDELGELPLPVQGKLLRVLQDREFERVGGTQTVKVDVRIVAATNRDLMKMVSEGKFREDLYYRIKVVEMVLPPLRERGGEDIERLARHFVATAAKRHRLETPRLSAAALERLKTYRWPGNVRELENCVESAVVLCEGEILEEHLPLPTVDRGAPAPATGSTEPTVSANPAGLLPLAEVERHHILRVLESVKGNRTAAAKVLEIGRNTLARKLKEYGFADEA